MGDNDGLALVSCKAFFVKNVFGQAQFPPNTAVGICVIEYTRAGNYRLVKKKPSGVKKNSSSRMLSSLVTRTNLMVNTSFLPDGG